MATRRFVEQVRNASGGQAHIPMPWTMKLLVIANPTIDAEIRGAIVSRGTAGLVRVTARRARIQRRRLDERVSHARCGG